MMDIIVCAGSNLFRMYVTYRFIRIFLEETKLSRVKEVACYLLFWIVNTALYLLFQRVWINIVCNLVGIALLVRMYTKVWKENIFVTVSIYVVGMMCDAFVTFLFIPYKDGNMYNQVYGAIGILLMFVCELIAGRIVSGQKNRTRTYHLSLICIPLCSILLVTILIYTKSSTYRGITIICLGLFLINFLMFYFYSLFLKLSEEKHEAELLEYQMMAYRNQINVMLESVEKMKMFRHDMKHHLAELRFMAERKDFSEFRRYLNAMEEFFEKPSEIVSSGNMEVDSVLNYMLQKAKKMQLNTTVKVAIPEDMKHSFDLNIIIGNLLQNAIDAAVETEEKFLGVEFSLKNGILVLKIENSFLSERIRQDKYGDFLTTKKDSESHGIGLKSVKRMVEKYHGDMSIKVQDAHFCAKLMLYI